MDALEAIFTRRSIRTFTRQKVSDEHIETLLRAGMAAPSAGNQQAWEFVVIGDPAVLEASRPRCILRADVRRAPLTLAICAIRPARSTPGSGSRIAARPQNASCWPPMRWASGGVAGHRRGRRPPHARWASC
ncbi:MAG: nitroreductase family protein [Candidatus Krumholzibacteriia bacterium]